MLVDGDVIEIDGKQATVCFNTKYNDTNYICVCFEDGGYQYDFYKYKYEGDRLLVAKLDDESEKQTLLELFVKKGIEEVGIPKELKEIIDNQ